MNISDPYYYAYDKRYRKVHSRNLTWFSSEPTPEVEAWLRNNRVSREEQVLEIGIGEGRDLIYLTQMGYRIKGVDISPTAIQFCKERARKEGVIVDLQEGDALHLVNKFGPNSFKWIYSVATLHMLVEKEHRDKFLQAVYHLLEPGGKALLVNMGDGETPYVTDINLAFDEEKRNHPGEDIWVASTSCRKVSWDYHLQEIEEAGFIVEKKLSTANREYGQCMTVYLTKG